MVRFPITCTVCGQESLNAMPIGMLAATLLEGSRIVLHADCHGISWPATDVEMEQVRSYIRILGLQMQRGTPGSAASNAGSSSP